MSPVSVSTSRSTHALETGRAKLWILLVGVNQYQDDSLPSLQYSALDCQGLAEAIATATAEFPNKEVITHNDFTSQLPTRKIVWASLQQIVASVESQDTILFYFSGHGILEPNTQQAVLCLSDTNKNNLLETGLLLPELLQHLGNSVAHQQLVWLDACHSGGMTLRGTLEKNQKVVTNWQNRALNINQSQPLLNPTPQLVEILQQRAAKSKGFYALLSCDETQQSWEFPELGHGVFTYYLMRGLRGEAADSQGVIEADGLYRYVYYQTLQYIDKTNQQLRLINQQKRGKGDNQLYQEYPLQTPKRIVEGIGELILGLKSPEIEQRYPRQALVIEGLSSTKNSLALSKVLREAGGFELKYLPRSNASWLETKQAIKECLHTSDITAERSPHEAATVLIYLRGRISQDESGEAWLLIGDHVRISRSWLRQALRRSKIAQQIIILDCPGASSPADWVEDLQLGVEQGQCLIAASSPIEEPERFTKALLDTLIAAPQTSGLSVAGWINQLQVEMAGSGIPLYVWLSGTQGVIEVLLGKTLFSRGTEQTPVFDLNICPYQGLRAFTQEDAQYFYGRETLTNQLINQLSSRSFLAVVGASGSGKSSVVQAGLIAQLRQGNKLPHSEQWWIKCFRPGTRPLEALAKTLVNSTQKEKVKAQMQLEAMLYQGLEGFVYWIRKQSEPIVVLVVDQFEELFTLAPEEDRQRFLDLVLGAIEYAPDRFKLVITLRADFIAKSLEVPPLAKALQKSNILVSPQLTEDDYRRVIVNPAEQVGLRVEPELVEVLVQELSQSAGDLPLLEFVLEQLWQYRQPGELTLQTYLQKIGGLKGALERKAQAVYENLDTEGQLCAEWIFLSLTQLGEGTEYTRRRIVKSDLVVKKYPLELVERTLQVLTTAKLVVINLEEGDGSVGQSRGFSQSSQTDDLSLEMLKQEVTVEVAHEILIRHWSTLQWWLEENRARLLLQRQLRQAAQLWKKNDEQSDFLLRGVRLAEAEEIYVKYTDELSEDVQRFIEACLEERQQLQLQAKRRLRQAQTAVVTISILAIAASSFGGIAYNQKKAAQLREIEALNASSEALLLSNQQLEALIASVKAGKQLNQISAPIDTQVRTVSTLSQALSETQERDRLEYHSQQVNRVAFSPDGKLLASASDDNTVIVWHQNGTFKTITGHTNRVTAVTFSPNSFLLASGSADKTIKLFNTDGSLIQTFTGHKDIVTDISFSPDDKTIASASRDNTVKLWRIDGTLLKTLTGHSGWVNSVSFSPDGKTIASGSEDQTVKLYSTDGTLIKTLTGHSARITSVTFSPKAILASASGDGTIKLWHTSGKLLKTITADSVQVNSISFSSNGELLASAGTDNTVKLWSVDGTLLKTIKGHGEQVLSISFAANGKILASASADKTVRLWDINNIRKPDKEGIFSVSVSPDGKKIASASWDQTIKLWYQKGVTSELFKILKGHKSTITSLSFSPDGKTLASGSADKTIKLWNADNGSLVKTIIGHTDVITSVSFSPDGKLIASGSADKTIKLWNVQNSTLLKTFTGHKDAVASISFSPDGILASGSYDNAVKLWAIDGTLRKTLRKHSLAVSSVSFSPDGTKLASASWDNTIRIWNVAEGTLLHTLSGHRDGVTSVSFSPDGKVLVSGSADKTIKLWSVADGTLLKSLLGLNDQVRSVSLGQNTLISASDDLGIVLWNLDLDNLVTQSCDRLQNYLKTNPNIKSSDRQLCNIF